jgi:hypothetical protein
MTVPIHFINDILHLDSFYQTPFKCFQAEIYDLRFGVSPFSNCGVMLQFCLVGFKSVKLSCNKTIATSTERENFLTLDAGACTNNLHQAPCLPLVIEFTRLAWSFFQVVVQSTEGETVEGTVMH